MLLILLVLGLINISFVNAEVKIIRSHFVPFGNLFNISIEPDNLTVLNQSNYGIPSQFLVIEGDFNYTVSNLQQTVFNPNNKGHIKIRFLENRHLRRFCFDNPEQYERTLWAIMNAIPEGFEIIDNDGLKYIGVVTGVRETGLNIGCQSAVSYITYFEAFSQNGLKRMSGSIMLEVPSNGTNGDIWKESGQFAGQQIVFTIQGFIDDSIERISLLEQWRNTIDDIINEIMLWLGFSEADHFCDRVKQCACGNGVLDLDNGEECDDGNNIDGDGCNAECVIEFCGDGTINNINEQCDDGNQNDDDQCTNDCTFTLCGDSIVQSPNGAGTGGPNNDGFEDCDDGDLDNTDACLNSCTDASCGDRFLWIGVEQCDDGNNIDGDGCNAECVIEFCGDGTINNINEQCDDGNNNNLDLCRNNCTLPFCGDGILDAGEECDDANNNNTDECSNACEEVCIAPIDVMLLIDRSGSMNTIEDGNTRLARAKNAATTFLDKVNFTKDKAGLASFNHIATLNQGLTNNQALITNAINALTATGQTNIGGGINVSRKELISSGGDTKTLVMLSDGAPNINATGGICFGSFALNNSCAKHAVNEANVTKLAGIKIFTIGLGIDALTETLLKQIATTPSNYFSAPNSTQLESIYLQIAEEICPK